MSLEKIWNNICPQGYGTAPSFTGLLFIFSEMEGSVKLNKENSEAEKMPSITDVLHTEDATEEALDYDEIEDEVQGSTLKKVKFEIEKRSSSTSWEMYLCPIR